MEKKSADESDDERNNYSCGSPGRKDIRFEGEERKTYREHQYGKGTEAVP